MLSPQRLELLDLPKKKKKKLICAYIHVQDYKQTPLKPMRSIRGKSWADSTLSLSKSLNWTNISMIFLGSCLYCIITIQDNQACNSIIIFVLCIFVFPKVAWLERIYSFEITVHIYRCFFTFSITNTPISMYTEQILVWQRLELVLRVVKIEITSCPGLHCLQITCTLSNTLTQHKCLSTAVVLKHWAWTQWEMQTQWAHTQKLYHVPTSPKGEVATKRLRTPAPWDSNSM